MHKTKEPHEMVDLVGLFRYILWITRASVEDHRGEVVVGGLGAADELYGTVLAEQQLGAAQSAVVVVAHGEAVRARVVDGEDIADLQLGEHAVDGELVVVLAQPAHDVVLMRARLVFLAQHGDVMICSVHGGAHEVGGAGVHAGVFLVYVLEVYDGGDEVAVRPQHVAAELGAQGRLHVRSAEHALVLRLDLGGDERDVGLVVLGQIGYAHAARKVDEGEFRARFLVQFLGGLEEYARESGVVIVAQVVGREEGVQSEALDAVRFQFVDRLGELRAGHAVLGILRGAHDAVAHGEVHAVVVAQGHAFGHVVARDVLEKVDVREVVQRDGRAQLERVSVLFGGRFVGGEHDVVPRDAAFLAQHQLGHGRAVHAAAERVQQLHDGGVGRGLDGEMLLETLAPREGLYQLARVVLDAFFVIDVEGRGVGLFDLLRLLFGNDRSLDVHTQIITIFARLVKDLTALRASRTSRVAAFPPLVVARAALCEIFLGIMCILLRKTRDKWYNIEWSDGGADRRRRK